VLSRRLDEAIVIQDNIVVTVLAVEGDKVKLGISAPRNVTVLRQELCEAVRAQNEAAALRDAQASRQDLAAVRRLLSRRGGDAGDKAG
jgi:carbon storage regulator